jgi:hypothetical protein
MLTVAEIIDREPVAMPPAEPVERSHGRRGTAIAATAAVA